MEGEKGGKDQFKGGPRGRSCQRGYRGRPEPDNCETAGRKLVKHLASQSHILEKGNHSLGNSGKKGDGSRMGVTIVKSANAARIKGGEGIIR